MNDVKEVHNQKKVGMVFINQESMLTFKTFTNWQLNLQLVNK